MTTIAAALVDLLDSTVPLDDAVHRHFTPDYRQRTNDQWDDRTAFVAHMHHLRSLLKGVDIEVLDELSDGNRYAERHVITAHKRAGGDVVQEVYVFGERDADGRFRRIEETTLMLHGDEADRGLGNAR